MKSIRLILTFLALGLIYSQYGPPVLQTHWLGDQVDQIQNASSLLSGHHRYLYGPYMSSTSPPVATPGPLGGLIFGIPVVLGLTPDIGHIYLQVLLWSALALFVAPIWRVYGLIAAAFSLVVVLSTSIWWWNSGIYWSNVLILACSLAQIAFLVKSANDWRPKDFWWHLVLFLVGVQIHIVYLCLLPVLAFAFLKGWRQRRVILGELTRNKLIWLMLGLAVLPYVVAELSFDFQNSKAILAHLGQNDVRSHEDGIKSFGKVLEFYGETVSLPLTALLGQGLDRHWLVMSAVALVTVTVYGIVKKKQLASLGVLLLLGVVTALWHAVFFYKMNRPIQGRHYLSMGLPMAVLWMSVVLFSLRHVSKLTYWLLGSFLISTIWSGALFRVSKESEVTPWTWNAVQRALTEICPKYGTNGLDILEDRPFLTYSSDHDPVFRYTVKRWDFGCRYDPKAKTLIYAAVSGYLPKTFEHRGGTWELMSRSDPSIGVYQLHD